MILIISLYIIYFLLNIGLAKVDANKIKNKQTINHTENAWDYFGMLIPAFVIVYFKFDAIYAAIICIALACLRKFVFDTALNVLRGLPADYISETTTSEEDQKFLTIEERMGYWPFHIIFLVLSIGLAFIKL